MSSLPGATGSLLADGPQLGSWQVAVMRVDETPAGDTPGRKCPRAEQNWQRPIDVSEVTGNVRPVLPAGGSPLAGVVNPASPDGPVVAGGPVGPCEMPSPYSEKTQEPLEQAVLIQADPAGQSAAVGTLSQSDCYLLAQLARKLQGALLAQVIVLEPFEKLILDQADPAGQHAIILDTAEPLEHAVVENILDGRPMEGITCPELLEYSLRLLDVTLDGGLVEKISDWEPEATLDGRLREWNTYLEHSAPGVSLDSGLMEGMSHLEPLEQSVLNRLLVARPSKCVSEERSEWKPVINPVISYTLDGRLRQGNTYLERSALGVSLFSGLMEGASCLEPLEQSVLSSSLVARPIEGITEKVSDWKPVINPVQDITPDGRPMEGTAYPEHSALGCLWTVDSGRGCRA